MKTTLVLSILLCCVLNAHAQWQPTTYIGGAFALTSNGTVIVASDTTTKVGDMAIMYSADLGHTWRPSKSGPPYLLQLQVHGKDFYGMQSGSQSTLWRSQDNAQTWDSLAVLPGYGQLTINATGFLYNSDSKLYNSTDGTHWAQLDSSVIPNDSLIIGSGPTGFFVWQGNDSLVLGALGNWASRYLYFSDDLGMTWKRAISADSLSIIALYGSGTVIATQDSGDILRSTDTGRTWSKIASALPSFFWQQGDMILGTTYRQLILSTDRGATWQTIDTMGLGYDFIEGFTVEGGYLFVMFWDKTIYRYPLPSNAEMQRAELSMPRLYPNPAQTTLHLSGSEPNGRATIIDALGRTVLETSVAANGEIDIHTLPAGAYTLMLSASKHFRFVK